MSNILLFVFGSICGCGLVCLIFAARKGTNFLVKKYSYQFNFDSNNLLNNDRKRKGYGSNISSKIIRKRRGYGTKFE
jgi:hypothetical protein